MLGPRPELVDAGIKVQSEGRVPHRGPSNVSCSCAHGDRRASVQWRDWHVCVQHDHVVDMKSLVVASNVRVRRKAGRACAAVLGLSTLLRAFGLLPGAELIGRHARGLLEGAHRAVLGERIRRAYQCLVWVGHVDEG